MAVSYQPRHTAIFAHAGRAVVLVPQENAAQFGVLVDDLSVVTVYVDSLGERTYWTCAACGCVLRGKRSMVKHVVGHHYPAAYRAASRAGLLPRPFVPPPDLVLPIPLAVPLPSVAQLQAWIQGGKPATAAS